MTLDKLKCGESAIIKEIKIKGFEKHRLLDMGVLSGTKVKTIRVAPFGDPMEIALRGYNITIRKQTAKQIELYLGDDLTVRIHNL